MRKIELIAVFLLLAGNIIAEPIMEISGSALDSSETKYRYLMENMVNAKTPGYRELNAKNTSVGKGKVSSQPYYNFTQGDFINTGRKFDFAIEGKGFFCVRTKEGLVLYTRDGRFSLDNEDRLVTVAGSYLLMGESGPIVIDESPEKVAITETGKIMQDGNVSDRMKIVDFSDYQVLRPLSGSFFYVNPEKGNLEIVMEDYRIRSGVIEGPNINMSRQLAELPQVQKTYDANARALQFRLKSMASSMEMGKVQ